MKQTKKVQILKNYLKKEKVYWVGNIKQEQEGAQRAQISGCGTKHTTSTGTAVTCWQLRQLFRVQFRVQGFTVV